MSDFTRFTAEHYLTKDSEASKVLGKDYQRVTKAFTYYIGHEHSDKWVTVPEGFLTDGASIPKIFQWLLPPFGEYAQAATLHDWLCEHYYVYHDTDDFHPTTLPVDRKEIDRIMYEAMRVLGVAKWRRTLIQGGLDTYRFLTRPKKPVVDPRKVELEKRVFNS